MVSKVCIQMARVNLYRYTTGDAELVFSAADFGNFLVHPLTVAAAGANGPGGRAVTPGRQIGYMAIILAVIN